MKNIIFLSEHFQFLEANFSIYLNRHVFDMKFKGKHSPRRGTFFFFFPNQNVKIFFLFFHEGTCCGYSLEVPH